MFKDYIQLLRPHQYIKNIFIFLPLFFGLKITQTDLLLNTFIAFISFCLVASSVYIFNDYYDIEDDKKHPEKKNRPLASGKIQKNSSLLLMFILLTLGLIVSLVLNFKLLILLSIYLVLNVAYTISLKHIVLIDILIISSGFIIRLFIGSVASGVSLSLWIVIITFLLALFLSLAKRRYDLLIYLESGNKVRKVIDGYNMEFLNASMMIMASVIIVSYLMYTTSPDVLKRIKSDNLYITVLWVIVGILRYMQITLIHNNSGSPTMVILKDRFIQIVLLGWIITFALFIY